MLIEAGDVSRIYRAGDKTVTAVKDAAISIREGERVYIHGRSGAGKSTLLH
ncbi:MAG: ATP-binding cassette domain-containing protein, partial [Candidatus Omnitrophota bacterium]